MQTIQKNEVARLHLVSPRIDSHFIVESAERGEFECRIYSRSGVYQAIVIHKGCQWGRCRWGTKEEIKSDKEHFALYGVLPREKTSIY